MALIEIRGLTKLYRMGTSIVRALDGVDLTIEKGEFVAITGASGSGKSTMMHLLGCLDRPTSGRFMFDGRDVGDMSDRQLAAIRNQQIGFVFQTFNLMNRTSALENVAVPLFYARQRNTFGPARKAIERVGLTDRAGHRSNELSGGERQRVAIARAIVNDPVLLLADEPTGNLDSRTGQQIMELFAALNRQGVTVVLVTHEQEVALQTRRIVHMRDGQIIADRPTAELIAQDQDLRPKKALVQERPGDRQPVPAPALAAPVPVAAVPARPRLVQGANAALVCGLVGPAFYAATAIGMGLMTRGVNLQALDPTKPPPTNLLVAGLVSFGVMVLAVVMGIITIFVASGARRRLRYEPGQWRGKWRALASLLLGWATALWPVILLAIGLLRRLV